jgi:hypothetical protein
MDAKRLEEIRQWAHYQAIEQTIDGSSVDADYFRDLARCAAAWAKVERERGNGALYINHKTVTWFHGENDYTNGDTAIAAVEAAPEVKP